MKESGKKELQIDQNGQNSKDIYKRIQEHRHKIISSKSKHMPRHKTIPEIKSKFVILRTESQGKNISQTRL